MTSVDTQCHVQGSKNSKDGPQNCNFYLKKSIAPIKRHPIEYIIFATMYSLAPCRTLVYTPVLEDPYRQKGRKAYYKIWGLVIRLRILSFPERNLMSSHTVSRDQ